MVEFHETPMGRTLIERTLPELARQVGRLADAVGTAPRVATAPCSRVLSKGPIARSQAAIGSLPPEKQDYKRSHATSWLFPPSAAWGDELELAVEEQERLAAIRKCGGDEAVALMWAKNRSD